MAGQDSIWRVSEDIPSQEAMAAYSAAGSRHRKAQVRDEAQIDSGGGGSRGDSAGGLPAGLGLPPPDGGEVDAEGSGGVCGWDGVV